VFAIGVPIGTRRSVSMSWVSRTVVTPMVVSVGP